MEFGLFLRDARIQAGHQTTRQFFDACSPSCSYSHYTRIEKGEVSADSTLAWELLSLLAADHRRGMMTWAKDHMPNDEAKGFFSEISSLSQPAKTSISESRTLTIRESHILELIKNPILFEIVTYLNILNPHKSVLASEISDIFKVDQNTVIKYLHKLEKLHLVSKDKLGRYSTEHWVVIPFDQSFGDLRDSNLEQAFSQFKKINKHERFRFTYTRFVTKEQHNLIINKILEFVNSLPMLEDEPTLKQSYPLTLGFFLSERRFGNA
jgi:predicted transcriptional regulator